MIILIKLFIIFLMIGCAITVIKDIYYSLIGQTEDTLRIFVICVIFFILSITLYVLR